jgi:hypothetical protein
VHVLLVLDQRAVQRRDELLGVALAQRLRADVLDHEQLEPTSLRDPKIQTRPAELGGTGVPGSPADFGNADETEKWGKVVKFAGIKAE